LKEKENDIREEHPESNNEDASLENTQVVEELQPKEEVKAGKNNKKNKKKNKK
jgi:hypothetical protein